MIPTAPIRTREVRTPASPPKMRRRTIAMRKKPPTTMKSALFASRYSKNSRPALANESSAEYVQWARRFCPSRIASIVLARLQNSRDTATRVTARKNETNMTAYPPDMPSMAWFANAMRRMKNTAPPAARYAHFHS
jgi:hypothetical protein